ncbi:MAG: hypothetical protein F4X97_14020 [Boseongicola sp. SB0662_bin_57]|nr:hypothetical protein [Boseongicola sp. SB0662_bin_57]
MANDDDWRTWCLSLVPDLQWHTHCRALAGSQHVGVPGTGQGTAGKAGKTPARLNKKNACAKEGAPRAFTNGRGQLRIAGPLSLFVAGDAE